MTRDENILFLRREFGYGCKKIASLLSIPFTTVESVLRAERLNEILLNPIDESLERRATFQHLLDIHREHGYHKRWASYSIPPEISQSRPRPLPVDMSLFGSPAAQCAGF